MKFFKKLVFLSLGFFGLLGNFFAFADEGSNSEDFLNQAFSPSVNNDLVVGQGLVGNTKEWVGNFLLNGGVEISRGGATKKDSFVVSLTKFIVRFTLILAITMIIYNGIMFVVKSTKGEAPKDVLKNIIYIIVGVLLALASVVIIRLAGSVGTSSLEMTRDMLSYHSTNTFNS